MQLRPADVASSIAVGRFTEPSDCPVDNSWKVAGFKHPVVGRYTRRFAAKLRSRFNSPTLELLSPWVF
jgi:hypothetical protein